MWEIDSKYLQSDEHIEFIDRPSRLSCINAYILLGLIMFVLTMILIEMFIPNNKEAMIYFSEDDLYALMMCVVFALPALYLILKRLSTRYAITNKGLIKRVGIITARIRRVPFKDITSTEVKETIAGKIFRYAHLIINTSENGESVNLSWYYLRTAYDVKKLVEQNLTYHLKEDIEYSLNNKPRRPWIAALLTLLTIGLGHLYSGNPKRGLILCGIGLLLTILFCILMPFIPSILFTYYVGIFAFLVFCVVDAMSIARRKKKNYKFAKYNRWIVYIGYVVVWSLVFAGVNASLIEKYFIPSQSMIPSLLVGDIIIGNYFIPSQSMIPSLLVGDIILVNKFIYGVKFPLTRKTIIPGTNPKRDDIVVFVYPNDRTKDYIKRVIGISGDTIEIKDKKIFINGKEYSDSYGIHIDTMILPASMGPRDNFGPVTVPENSIFVMGDNRDNSDDSRYWGLVNLKDVKGKAFMICFSWNGYEHEPRWKRIGYLLSPPMKSNLEVTYYNRGSVYFKQKQYQLAIKDYNKAIRLNPDYEVYYNDRGQAYSEQKQYQLAIKDYNEAIRLNPDDEAAYFYRGTTYFELKQYQQAIKDYNQAIRLKPDETDSYFLRGQAYFELKQYQLAIKDYNQAIRLKPDEAIFYRHRGNSYSNLGQYQLAIKEYDKAISLKHDYAKAHSGRGLAYIISGNKVEGCRSLIRACELKYCQDYDLSKQKDDCR